MEDSIDTQETVGGVLSQLSFSEIDNKELEYEVSEESLRLLQVIRDLSEDHPDGVPIANISEEATKYDLQSSRVDEYIGDLLMSGKIYEPKEGNVKII